MMRRLVRAPQRHPAARHRREHLARHHRDLHPCAGAVLPCMPTCRPATPRCATARASISASRCRSCRIWARPAWSRRSSESKGDLGLVPAFAVAGAGAVVERARRRQRAEDHRAAAVRRARRIIRPRCRCSWSRAPRADAMVTEVEVWSVRVAGLERRGRPRRSRRSPRSIAVPDRRLRRRGAADLGAAGGRARRRSPSALVKAGATVRSAALVGSHATRYTVAGQTHGRSSRHADRVSGVRT